jgi:GGDEF domain-containing protein
MTPARTTTPASPPFETDPSTGVATRNALLDRLEAMGQLAPNAPLSFAERLRELTRGTDIVGRLTGTTFGIALQGTGVTAAGAVAARLTHHLNRLAELGPAVCVTVSAATGIGLNAETLPVAAMETFEPCCG